MGLLDLAPGDEGMTTRRARRAAAGLRGRRLPDGGAASEVAHLEGVRPSFYEKPKIVPTISISASISTDASLTAHGCDGRAERAAPGCVCGGSSMWCRVALAGLTPMPALLRATATHARVSRRRCARRRCVSAAGSGATERSMNDHSTPPSFVGKFVEEARDRLKALGAALLRLEQTPGAVDAIAEAHARGAQHQGLRADARASPTSRRSRTSSKSCSSRPRQNPRCSTATRSTSSSAPSIRCRSRVEALARGQMDAVEVGDICARLAAVLDRGLTPVRGNLTVTAAKTRTGV